ncbi:hypothetical protein MLD38_012650 [Melastoma candidum]|uniref:Uncharacterized protein n=1 Tax=Melastoma candidum TaxID=119954 RepID=A0ACB9R702_9MYRT|nr:hypothetical protein MLD38_012650 [Melastoma candidum]
MGDHSRPPTTSTLHHHLLLLILFLSSMSALTRCDLEPLLGRLGAGACSQDEVEAMLRDVDLGVGDGGDIDELVGRLGSMCGGVRGGEEEELRQGFEFFDKDGDGRITAEELLGVLGGVMGTRVASWRTA